MNIIRASISHPPDISISEKTVRCSVRLAHTAAGPEDQCSPHALNTPGIV